MKRAISKKGQMLMGGAYEKGEFLLINMMPSSLRLFYHFFKRRIVNYILQSNFEETVIVFEEQCFLATLSFNISTLIKRAFLKKTATTFYHYSGLTAGSITLLSIISS